MWHIFPLIKLKLKDFSFYLQNQRNDIGDICDSMSRGNLRVRKLCNNNNAESNLENISKISSYNWGDIV